MKFKTLTTITPLTQFIRKIPGLNLEKGPWVAGGAARRVFEGRGLTEGDIDIFYPSREVRSACNILFNFRLDDMILNKMDNDNYRLEVKFGDRSAWIHSVNSKFFRSASQLFDDFDFSVCKFATDGYRVCFTEDAYSDHFKKRLNVDIKQNPKRSSTERVLKYMDYGFKINEKHLLWSLNLEHSICSEGGIVTQFKSDGNY